ncbi:MAG: dihydrodipicolinate synthase family protein, partial [Promethearchaeota archaeon]
MLEKIFGIIPPIITPLKEEDENVDEEGLRAVVDFLINNGATGIFVNGTSGEFPYLTLEERVKIARIVKDQVKSKGCVLMGIS